MTAVASLPEDLEASLSAILDVDFDPSTSRARQATAPSRLRLLSRLPLVHALPSATRSIAAAMHRFRDRSRQECARLIRSNEGTITLGLGSVAIIAAGAALLLIRDANTPVPAKPASSTAESSRPPAAVSSAIAEQPVTKQEPLVAAPSPANSSLPAAKAMANLPPLFTPSGPTRKVGLAQSNPPRSRTAATDLKLARPEIPDTGFEQAMIAAPQPPAADRLKQIAPVANAGIELAAASPDVTAPTATDVENDAPRAAPSPASFTPDKSRSRRDAIDSLLQLRRQF